MSRVGIITDSTNGLPPELIRQYDIRVAPMGVNINNKGYRDMVDIKPADVYELLKVIKAPGTTNAASPGDFLAIYQSLAQITDSVIYIGVSRILTATHEVARQAWQIFQEDHPGMKIELLDSKNCLGALGFLVLEAARASESGKNFNQVIEIVQSMIPRVKYFAVLDTLEHLVRIGRMPKNAITSATFNLRPVIGMTDGSGNVQNITAVPQAQAIEKLLEIAGKYIEPNKPLHAIVHYSERVQEAEELKKLVTGRYHCVEFYLTEYSPAAICSTGLMTGLSFYI